MIEPKLSENAIKVLQARYLQRDINDRNKIIETPSELFRRVAHAIADVELVEDRLRVEEIFYGMMASLDFLPNTPCLVNAGRPNGFKQYSACFVIPIPDTMSGVADGLKQMMLVQKTGGGTGFDFSKLRPEGDPVRSTSGIASGPISFMKGFDAITHVTKQGGVRRGANMGILRVDHPNILDFIRMKLDPSILQNFNISVAITDKFMAALEANAMFDLINPSTNKVTQTLPAREIWDEIIRCAWTIGDPGLFFVDRANAVDPLVPAYGPIGATNPCSEVPLHDHNACSLGSINLANFVGGNSFDYTRLSRTICDAVRFLDNMVSASSYPIAEIQAMTASTRKIGLGIMGWADALIKMGVPYASSNAIAMAEDLMKFFTTVATQASVDLGRERGAYPAYNPKQVKFPPRRNSTVTVIAPTGSISIIAGCSSGIEPLFALSMKREQASMTMYEHNPLVEEIAKRDGWWNTALETVMNTGSLRTLDTLPKCVRDVFKIANEIDVDTHVDMLAAFQKHTHDGVSKTINLANSATREDVMHAYMRAWNSGTKGITVYRDGCRDGQVLTVGTKAADPSVPKLLVAVDAIANKLALRNQQRRRIPTNGRRHGETFTRTTLYGSVHATINMHPDDDEPFEMFARIGKAGTEVNAWTDAFGRMTSLLLSLPSSITPRERLRLLASQLDGIGGSDSVGLGEARIVSGPDAIAKIINEYLGPIEGVQVDDTTMPGKLRLRTTETFEAIRRDICPQCKQATLRRELRCYVCDNPTCSYQRC